MSENWRFLPLGYALTVLVETPVLLLALSTRHRWPRRIIASLWLNACSYPVVILVLPALISSETAYLWVAETFAPLSECALFAIVFGDNRDWSDRSLWRDWAAIVAANLCSFAFGEWLFH
jgi:hypothetical protein